MAGLLFVVATPLGNLEDLSPRAVATLRDVDCVVCEDTRRTAKLLAHHGIRTPTRSCHKFNEREQRKPLLARMAAGQDLALVSDGGTPGISDPGPLLVRAAVEAGFEVRPIPGPSAAAALLSISGLPADRYVFEGFLPHRAGERRRRLRELAGERRPVVAFESPHRIAETLADVEQLLGTRPLVLGRELTKLHETVLFGHAREIRERLGDPVRGEITLVISGADAKREVASGDDADNVVGCWRKALEEHAGDRRAALRAASSELGLKRAELFRLLAELGEEPDRPRGR